MKTLINTIVNKAPALLLLIGAVTLLQIHSIQWWSQYDSSFGWLWAVTIEAGAVWLWASASKLRNKIAAVATALALIAPLHELAAPVLADRAGVEQAADTLPQRTQAAQQRVDALAASLAQYNDNSSDRTGWHSLIVSTQQQLTAAQLDLQLLQQEQHTPPPAGLSVWLPLAMQMLAIVLLQCLVVTTTRSLFRKREDTFSAADLDYMLNRAEKMQRRSERTAHSITDRLTAAKNAAAQTGQREPA